MNNLEFEGYPKTPRLMRGIVVTEKIDGTNGAVLIQPATGLDPADVAHGNFRFPAGAFSLVQLATEFFWVGAQSRNRLIYPQGFNPQGDNAGFAGWVSDHARDLVTALGPGRHFGEWWGAGIQRGYGLGEKRFSLFNADRWEDDPKLGLVKGLGVVPVLARHMFSTTLVKALVDDLRANGSYAAPGFARPEGVIVWHSAAGKAFKVLIDNDEMAKGATA